MIIRKMKYEDIKEFILLVNKVWDETYRGIVDDEFIDNMKNTIDERIKKGEANFNRNDRIQYVIEENGKLIGFSSISPSTDEKYPDSGEIMSLYLLKKYHGKGFGKILFNHDVDKLKELGYTDYIIGCLEGNPTNDFYRHMGGKEYKKVLKRIGDKDYPEIFYHFEMR